MTLGRPITISLCSVALLVLAACGGSSKNDAVTTSVATSGNAAITVPATSSTPTSATTSASPGTNSSLPSSPRLKAINIQPSELPASWTTGAASTNSPDDDRDNAALARCVGVQAIDTGKVAEAFSPDFNLGEATISSSASAVRSQTDVQASVDLLNNPKLAGCYQTLLKSFVSNSGLPSGATLGAISIEIIPGPNGGPDNVAGVLQGKIPIIADTTTTNLYETVVFITGPLTKAEVDASGVGNPVDSTLVRQLAAKVAERAAKG